MDKLFSLIIFTFVLIACSELKVKKDYSSDYNFKDLQTYTIVDDEHAPLENGSLIAQRAFDSLKKQLSNKGFTYMSSRESSPDFLVSVGYWEKEIVTPPASSVGVGYGRSSGFGFGGLSIGHRVGNTQEYETLQIKMFDANSNKEIWRGRVTGSLEYDDPKKTTAKFDKAVSKIIDEFYQGTRLSE